MSEKSQKQLNLNSFVRFLMFNMAFALLTVLPGCMSSYAQHLDAVKRDFYDVGDVSRAKTNLEKRQKLASKKEQDPLTLNAASLDISSGDLVGAKKKLIEVRNHFDELENDLGRKTSENLLKYWIDDNVVSYEGEDYEKVLIRAYLTIADLLDSGADARAYACQIATLQDEIVRKGEIDDPRHKGAKTNPKIAYPRVPLGPYLEGLICEETFTDSQEAARNYQKVAEWRPQFTQAKDDLIRAQTGVHSRPGFGRLYVFAFVGRGPHKEQINAEVTQFALLLADQIFSATNQYSVPPTLAPVPIPALVVEEPIVGSVAVDVDGKNVAATETITDVNEMAIRQYEATKDLLVARAVVRRVVKKGTIYAAKEAGQANSWINLAADVGGIVWEATETADTRCWGLLPAKIQVASVELPVGEHRLTFYPCGHRGDRVGETISKTVKIDANRNTYTLVVYPDHNPIADVVSSSDHQ